MKSHGGSARDAAPSAMQRCARIARSHRSSPDHVARPAALDLAASPSIVVRPSSVQLCLHVATLRDVSCAALRGTAAIIAPYVRPAHDERRDVARPRRATSATCARCVRRAHDRGTQRVRRAHSRGGRLRWSAASFMVSILILKRDIAVVTPIRSTTRSETPSSDCTRSPDEISTIGFSTSNWPERNSGDNRRRAATAHGGGGERERGRERRLVLLGIQLAVGPQPLWLRNHNSGPAQRIMVKRLATSPHDPLGITDSACKNQSVVVSVLYGPFNPYIPIRSTTIGKSRVARDPIAMHTSWRSNSDIASEVPDAVKVDVVTPLFDCKDGKCWESVEPTMTENGQIMWQRFREAFLKQYFPMEVRMQRLSHVVDWAVKMRIRPPELETSICDAKYHVSLAAGLGETPMYVGVDASLSRIHRSLTCMDILCYLRG
ncbi:hypothetical protein F511_20341 [Dorcoceras hygrometricum]|uniref:Uncharacterized protein n=1 Tax=Dorcoceras hygrometricum TaxID=472368 RepID=A0A2Z7CV26_9LAMI|nr:hypothetical protein F511_20341 [Dorcoceras hygrometricum]